MEIRRYIQILDSRKWIIVVTAIVTLVVVTLGSLRMTRIYSASALVRISQRGAGLGTWIDLNYTDRLIQTYVLLLRSRPYLDEVTTWSGSW